MAAADGAEEAVSDDRDLSIAQLHDYLVAKAKEEVEVEGKQRQVLAEHDVATTDQQQAELTDRAKLLGSYFTQLQANGVDPDTAMWLVRDEAEWLRECG